MFTLGKRKVVPIHDEDGIDAREANELELENLETSSRGPSVGASVAPSFIERSRVSATTRLSGLTVKIRKTANMTSRAVCDCLPPLLLLPMLSVLLVAMILVLMLPVFYVFRNEASADRGVAAYPPNMTQVPLIKLNQISLVGRVLGVNPTTYTTTISFDVIPGGDFKQSLAYGSLQLPKNYYLSLYMGRSALTFYTGDSMETIPCEIAMHEKRRLIDFPFDSYAVNMTFMAYIIAIGASASYDGYNNNKSSFDIPADWDIEYNLPVGVLINTAMQGFTIHNNVYSASRPNVSIVIVELYLQRSCATKFFSIFIVILMWCLSLAMMIIAIQHVFLSKAEVTFETPALAIGMLFALPFVRDVQPGVPAIGCSVDVLGFFWNMMLISFAAIILMCRIVGQPYAKNKVRVAPGTNQGHSLQCA